MSRSNDLSTELLRELGRCRACRFCVDVCPTYQSSGGVEILSPYGRIQVLRHLLCGISPLDEGLSYALYSCLQCRRCENQCHAKGQDLPIARLIRLGRAHLAPNYLPAARRRSG